MAKTQVIVSRNIYESISSIIYASKLCGICPLLVSGKVNSFILTSSKRIMWFSYVSVAILVCISIFGLVQNYQIKEVYNIRLGTVTGLVCTLFENVSLLFSCLLGTIIAPFYQHHFLKYLECLQQVDYLLGSRNLNQKRMCTRILAITLTITFIIIIADVSLWSIIVIKKTPLFIYLPQAVPFYLTYVSKMIMELHFWALVHLIKVRLVCLNEDLLELLRGEEGDSSDVFLKNNEYINKKLVKVISCHNDVIGSGTGKTLRGDNRVFKKVKNSINIHNLLVEAAAAANSYFGINVLVFLFGCLVHLLVTPYTLYLQIKETKNHIFVASQLIWLISHISRLIFIIEPCQSCKTQIQLTVATICKLLRCQISNEVKMQLRAFLEQIDRCRIEFSGCSLVTIDRTLLTTVTGTVTTYLVILFQFK